jgi:hypothetical protein
MKRCLKATLRRESTAPKLYRHSYPPTKPTLGDLVQVSLVSHAR